MSNEPTVVKLDCPSCGAPISYGAAECKYCNTPLIILDNGESILPKGMSVEVLMDNIIAHEDEFWTATTENLDAPFSIYSKSNQPGLWAYSPGDWKKDLSSTYQYKKTMLEPIFDKMLLLKGEGWVARVVLTQNPLDIAILTNYRLFIIRSESTITSVPLSAFISYKDEHFGDGLTTVGIDGRQYLGQAVLRWKSQSGEEQEIRWPGGAQYISESVTAPVIQAADWDHLSPLQKQLLACTRWSLKKGMTLNVPPLTPTEMSPVSDLAAVASAACFPGESMVLTPEGYKRIADLDIGCAVFSYTPDHGIIARTITRKMRYDSAKVWCLRTTNAKAMRVTGHHTLLTAEGWKKVEALQVGDQLLHVDGPQTLSSIDHEPGHEPVYYLHTNGEHNFIVEGFVAHNFTSLRWIRTALNRLFVDPFYRSTSEKYRLGDNKAQRVS